MPHRSTQNKEQVQGVHTYARIWYRSRCFRWRVTPCASVQLDTIGYGSLHVSALLFSARSGPICAEIGGVDNDLIKHFLPSP